MAIDNLERNLTSVEIRVESHPKLLKIVRCGIQHLCHLCEFSDAGRNELILAVDEAVANIIRHSYKGADDQPINVFCEVHEDRLQIVLQDFGEEVDKAVIKSRDLDDIRPGGLGVHLIQSVMDEVEFSYSKEDGNKLKLVKYLPGRKQEND
ncbi:MAG: ATP-binding protein [Calditrichia bacterium]